MENKEEKLKNESNLQTDDDEMVSFSFVDEEGKRHETIGYFVSDPEGKTIEERIREMQEIIKNTK